MLAGVTDFPRLLYAHRGANAELPDNTLPAFRRAIERGATALETDAHMTADGHVVLSHDPSGLRMANVAREIRDCSLDEVQSWDVGWGFVDPATRTRPFLGEGFRIPLLEDLLREVPSVPINVDVKQREPDMVGAVMSILERTGNESRVRLASFSTRTLRRIRAAGYPGPTGLSQNEVAAIYFTPRAALGAFRDKRLAAQVPLRVWRFRFDDRAFIDKCHALGIRVDFWTVDDPNEARRLYALGADGVMTDDPQRIMRDGVLLADFQ
jgi:glycerophosphoryl diester phosphodiesterase